MMAILMCRDLFLGTQQIREPSLLLRLSVATYLNSASIAMNDSSTTIDGFGVDFVRNELIFQIVRRVDYDKFEYQLEGDMKLLKYTFSMYHQVIELTEPSEEISLNKLTSKMRDTLAAKELLVRYYNS